MADAEAAGGAGKPSVGDERNLVAHALAVERSGRRQHLAHARATLGALVADHQNLAFLVRAIGHSFEALFLGIETARRTA
jgi:hypothetical protein